MTPSSEISMTSLALLVPDLRECLLISFSYDVDTCIFRLVTDYSASAADIDREFLALEFSGVYDFQRDIVDSSNAGRFETRYFLRDAKGNVVIQHVSYVNQSTSQKFALWFGPAFGGVTFYFRTVASQRRSAKTTEIKGEFIYRDFLTGERFEFENPFDDVQL